MEDTEELMLDHDALIAKIDRWKREEKERSSSAAETRQAIGQFLDDTGLNKKALAHMRAVDKLKPEKRQDYLRSLNALLEELQLHWDGQSTQDMFDGAGRLDAEHPDAGQGADASDAEPDDAIPGEFDDVDGDELYDEDEEGDVSDPGDALEDSLAEVP